MLFARDNGLCFGVLDIPSSRLYKVPVDIITTKENKSGLERNVFDGELVKLNEDSVQDFAGKPGLRSL